MPKNDQLDAFPKSKNNLIFKKDVLVVTEGIFLGIEEFIDEISIHSFSAVVLSEKAKFYEISLKVNLKESSNDFESVYRFGFWKEQL